MRPTPNACGGGAAWLAARPEALAAAADELTAYHVQLNERRMLREFADLLSLRNMVASRSADND